MGYQLNGWSSLTDLFLRPECPLFQRPAHREGQKSESQNAQGQNVESQNCLCSDCQRQLYRCRLPQPNKFWQPPLPVLAWGEYGGALKRSLAALKYDNQPRVAYLLGRFLAEAWLESPAIARSLAHPLAVIPIPLHASKLKQRGYNQAELIARAFCDRTKLPMAHGLKRDRETIAQFGLTPEERMQNLTDAFCVDARFSKRHASRTVLLLDDIYTTGTTARAAVQVLRQSGIAVAGILAVAKAGLR